MTQDPDTRDFVKSLTNFAMNFELVCRQRDELLHAAEAYLEEVSKEGASTIGLRRRLAKVVEQVRQQVPT